MEKIVDATYDGEVVRFDEPIAVAPNTRVRVVFDDANEDLNLEFAKKKKSSQPYSFLRFARSLSLDLPPDYSATLDDYLYRGKTLPDAE